MTTKQRRDRAQALHNELHSLLDYADDMDCLGFHSTATRVRLQARDVAAQLNTYYQLYDLDRDQPLESYHQ